MIKIEKYEVMGWEHAIRGMRNPMNSWDKSDSGEGCTERNNWNGKIDTGLALCKNCGATYESHCVCSAVNGPSFCIGPNDLALMKKLRNAGTDHRKFMRMIAVYVDITAPMYWWKEFSTYRVGVIPNPTDIEMNSTSTMHKIHAKEFDWRDFSNELLMDDCHDEDYGVPLIACPGDPEHGALDPTDILSLTIVMLNACRTKYLETKDMKYWHQMIQLLPSSYNYTRTLQMNYEVLANIYGSRKNHKLHEWREFCEWIKTLPYSELITGEE